MEGSDQMGGMSNGPGSSLSSRAPLYRSGLLKTIMLFVTQMLRDRRLSAIEAT